MKRASFGVILAVGMGGLLADACSSSSDLANVPPDASLVDAPLVEDSGDAKVGDAANVQDASDARDDAPDAVVDGGDAGADASDADADAADAAQPPSCIDGTQNGDETDVDCGGSCTQKCGDAMACVASADCTSGVCQLGVCQAPVSFDGVQNGTESDVDCGGGAPTNAPRCGDNKMCVIGDDCETSVCTLGTCSCGPGLAFNGAASMTISGGVPLEVAGNNATKHVEAWIRPSVGTGVLGIVRLGNDAGGCGTPACGGVTFRFAVRNGVLHLDVSQGSADSTVAVATNQWTFVFAGYQGGAYYVGKIEGGVVTRQNVTIPNGITTSTLAVGQASAIGQNLGGTVFRGVIDGVRVWSTVPLDAELLARHRRGVAALTPGLVRQWWMEEGTGTTTIEDVTATPTPIGGATWTFGSCQ